MIATGNYLQTPGIVPQLFLFERCQSRTTGQAATKDDFLLNCRAHKKTDQIMPPVINN